MFARRKPSGALRTSRLPATVIALTALTWHLDAAAQQAPTRGVPPAAAAQPTQVAPSGATAVAPDEARAHFERGLTLANLNDYGGALAEFERSYEMSRRPSVLYNMGSMYQALHRYGDAVRTIERFLHEATTITPQRRAEVERGLARLRSLIGYVVFDGAAPGTTLTVDGEPATLTSISVPFAIGPGRHEIEARAPGRETARVRVVLASGETRHVALVMPAVSSTAGPRSALVGDGRGGASGGRSSRGGGLGPGPFVVALGTSAALGAIAIVLGVRVQGALAEFERLTQEDEPLVSQLASRGATEATVANAMMIGAGVTGAVAIVLLTQTRFVRERPAVALAPTVFVAGTSGGIVGLGGRF